MTTDRRLVWREIGLACRSASPGRRPAAKPGCVETGCADTDSVETGCVVTGLCVQSDSIGTGSIGTGSIVMHRRDEN